MERALFPLLSSLIFQRVECSTEMVAEFYGQDLSQVATRHRLYITDLSFIVKEDRNTIQAVAWAKGIL